VPPLCEACGEQNAEGARFCSRCGSALGSAPVAVEERKVVSVLFVDLVDFTARSDRADPEDVRAMLLPYHTRVKAEIESFGGLVEKFIGDAVMAVFGAPISHGDDADRAVRAGLRVLEAITQLNEEDPGLNLTVRAAVNTGEAIVDASAQPDASRGVAHGDVVNTASRLQTGAPPGALVVGEETYRATRQAIAYRPVDPIVAKGKREPLAAWQALHTVTGPAERPGSATPMVGRDRELDMLRGLWEASTTELRPRMATVVGPPGIGKTRLTGEFATLVEASGGRVVRGRSLPYGESTAYRAFSQQVKDVAGIFETDTPGDARSKVAASVAGLCGDKEHAEIAEHLTALIGLSEDGVSADRAALFFSARRFVEELAQAQPLLLVFEDIHWADQSQLELLESLASRVRDVPLMLLALCRPELYDTRPGWAAGLTAHTTMELHPLGPEDARTMCGGLLERLAGRSEALDGVVTTAEGNPLFIEELVASLAERVDDAAAELPTNVKTTIAARLDTLPASARATLLDAAVIGKIFWRGALLGMGDRQASALDDDLDQLETRDFVRRERASQIQDDREYVFKHMLIREVAYATLPRAARRERHAAAARFIEAASSERLAEAAAVLAHHWREAGDESRAVEYLLMAADHAARRWGIGESVGLYAQALELVPEDQVDLRRSIATRRAERMVELGDYVAVIPILDEILPELEGRLRLPALLARSRAAFWTMDAPSASGYSQEASELASELGDQEFLGPAMSMRFHAAAMEGHLEDAIALGAQALEGWPEGSRLTEKSAHLNQLALTNYWRGEYETALEHCRRAVALADEVHSAEGTFRALSDLGMILTGLGRHEEALAQFDRMVALFGEVEISARWASRGVNMAGGTYREIHDIASARARNREGAEMGARSGFAMAVIQGGIDDVFTDLLEGEVGRAEAAMPALWEKAAGAKGWHQWLMAGRLAEASAEIALAKGDGEGAARAAEEAIRQATDVPRLKYRTAARIALGSALLMLGETDRAVAGLREAVGDAEHLRHPPTIWRASVALGRALATNGDEAAAGAALERAAETVRSFAATLAPERADRLLAAEPVQEILNPG
jgi:class 3 adenylate cyclase/tetratricopeptide (TPR) repeat protein